MPTLRMTSKRQATFPRSVCEALGIEPGDDLELESRVLDGETVWILRPKRVDWTWIGSVRVRRDVTDDIAAIRASASRGWGRSAARRA